MPGAPSTDPPSDRERADPGVDGGERARGVEVVGEAGSRTSATVASASGTRWSRHPRPPESPAGPPPGASTSSVHSHAGCGSGARGAPVGSPSARPRVRAARRRGQGCPWTCSSSRRRTPPSPGGRRSGRTAPLRTVPRRGRRSSRGAGRSGRCRRPAGRTARRGAAGRWSRTRCASPAGPSPRAAAGPRTVRRPGAPATAGVEDVAASPRGRGRRPVRRTGASIPRRGLRSRPPRSAAARFASK